MAIRKTVRTDVTVNLLEARELLCNPLQQPILDAAKVAILQNPVIQIEVPQAALTTAAPEVAAPFIPPPEYFTQAAKMAELPKLATQSTASVAGLYPETPAPTVVYTEEFRSSMSRRTVLPLHGGRFVATESARTDYELSVYEDGSWSATATESSRSANDYWTNLSSGDSNGFSDQTETRYLTLDESFIEVRISGNALGEYRIFTDGYSRSALRDYAVNIVDQPDGSGSHQLRDFRYGSTSDFHLSLYDDRWGFTVSTDASLDAGTLDYQSRKDWFADRPSVTHVADIQWLWRSDLYTLDDLRPDGSSTRLRDDAGSVAFDRQFLSVNGSGRVSERYAGYNGWEFFTVTDVLRGGEVSTLTVVDVTLSGRAMIYTELPKLRTKMDTVWTTVDTRAVQRDTAPDGYLTLDFRGSGSLRTTEEEIERLTLYGWSLDSTSSRESGASGGTVREGTLTEPLFPFGYVAEAPYRHPVPVARDSQEPAGITDEAFASLFQDLEYATF